MKSIVIDIDGTLSDPSHRRHLIEGEDKDWEKFFDKVDEDPVNEWCHQIVNRLWKDYQVILVTGRPAISKSKIQVRKKTEKWLKENGIYYNALIMRQHGDFREDTVVKQEILDENLPDPKDILFAIDDREDIAKMWRENGITCLQCKDEVKY